MAEENNSKDNKSEKKENSANSMKKKEQKYVKSVWRSVSVASIVLCVFLLGVILTSVIGSDSMTGMITEVEASQKAIGFIEENMVQPGTEVSVKDITEEGGLYRMKIEVKSGDAAQEVETYMTVDGDLFFPQAINITQVEEMMADIEEETEEDTEEPEVEKVEKPVAHAFVMSYCPYGLQFMKAYVPVLELLGDEADLELNFVDYAMHGKKELDENLRMYCIQKEQKEKLTDYLRCFVENDDYEFCIEDTGIDSGMLDSCVQSTDDEFNVTGLYNDESTWASGSFPLFPVESGMNEEYGVRGSPTFVLNGKVTSVTRSAEAIKDAICSSFIEPPEDCDVELSTSSEQPGIGPIGSTSGSGSTGSCG